MARSGLDSAFGVPPRFFEVVPRSPLQGEGKVIDSEVDDGRSMLGDPGDIVKILDNEYWLGLRGKEQRR